VEIDSRFLNVYQIVVVMVNFMIAGLAQIQMELTYGIVPRAHWSHLREVSCYGISHHKQRLSLQRSCFICTCINLSKTFITCVKRLKFQVISQRIFVCTCVVTLLAYFVIFVWGDFC
jgi:hypothetical protein